MTTIDYTINRTDQLGREYPDIPVYVQIGDHYIPRRPDVDDVEEAEVGEMCKVAQDCPLYDENNNQIEGEYLYREGALIALTDDEMQDANEAYIQEQREWSD